MNAKKPAEETRERREVSGVYQVHVCGSPFFPLPNPLEAYEGDFYAFFPRK